MKKRKTRKLSPDAARNYFGKAREFAESMRDNLQAKKWDAAGLSAVHAVISAADAILAVYGGVRSVESDHRMVVRLLEDVLGKAASPAKRHIAFVIAKKNVIEYEQRRLTSKEASTIATHTDRFLRFASDMLGKAK